MKNILSEIKESWFSPMPAERLAILRIATGCFALWYLLTRFGMMADMARSEASLYEPVGLAHLLPQPMFPALFAGLLVLAVVLNLAYIVGWKFRWTGPLFAVTLLFVFSYRNSWSMVYHNYIALVLQVLVIGLVASADRISLDHWRRQKSGSETASPDWQYGWPIKLICAATVLTYFLSGAAKVLSELAWDWINGDVMRSQVAVDALRKQMLGEQPALLFEWLYPHTWLFLFMGITTMVLELGAPLALLNRRMGVLWAVPTWLMHWGIFFIMGISFQHHMSGILFLPFFATEKPWFWLQKRFGQKNHKTHAAEHEIRPAIVLFDGVCNFCNATVRFIIDRDPAGHFQFASIQSANGQKLLTQHQAPSDLSTIVLIEDGKVYLCSSAVLRIARQLRSPWHWAYVLVVLPVALRDAGYRWVARHRYQWFGQKQEMCELPTPQIQARFLN
jgi:predicted DCC family thiol-disulfide oxidoreductase YuxK